MEKFIASVSKREKIGYVCEREMDGEIYKTRKRDRRDRCEQVCDEVRIIEPGSLFT